MGQRARIDVRGLWLKLLFLKGTIVQLFLRLTDIHSGFQKALLREPPENSLECSGSTRAHQLMVKESATSEGGKPGIPEALQALSSMIPKTLSSFIRKDNSFLWVMGRVGSFLVELGASCTGLFIKSHLANVDITTQLPFCRPESIVAISNS